MIIVNILLLNQSFNVWYFILQIILIDADVDDLIGTEFRIWRFCVVSVSQATTSCTFFYLVFFVSFIMFISYWYLYVLVNWVVFWIAKPLYSHLFGIKQFLLFLLTMTGWSPITSYTWNTGSNAKKNIMWKQLTPVQV